MGRGMVFGEIIGIILLAGCPVEIELPLRYPVLEPVVSHVERFGTFHADGGMEDTVRGGIVGLDWCPRLGLFVSHFFKSGANGDCFLSIEKQTPNFGFGGGGGDSLESFAEDVNGAVGVGSRR